MNWIIHFLVYLGNFPHFKETVESSILTHWFDLSAKAKVSIPEFCIQWGLMQAQRLPNCQHSVQKVWIPPSIGNRLPIWSSPFFPGNIARLKYWINTKVNSCSKVFSSFLEEEKTTLHAFFVSNTFISKSWLWLNLRKYYNWGYQDSFKLFIFFTVRFHSIKKLFFFQYRLKVNLML